MEENDDDREVSGQTLNRELTSTDVDAPTKGGGYVPLVGKDDHDPNALELANRTRGSKRAS